jgi:ribosomal protein S27AE
MSIIRAGGGNQDWSGRRRGPQIRIGKATVQPSWQSDIRMEDVLSSCAKCGPSTYIRKIGDLWKCVRCGVLTRETT